LLSNQFTRRQLWVLRRLADTDILLMSYGFFISLYLLMGYLMYVVFNGEHEVLVCGFLDFYFLAESLVNHVVAYSGPLEIFPRDYE